MFDQLKVNPQAFANKTSYTAAVWAGQTVNKMLALQKEGNQFFFEGTPIDLVFKIDYENLFEITLKSSGHSYTWFVGDETAEVKGEWKVWCTKKTLKQFFSQFNYIPKGSFKSII